VGIRKVGGFFNRVIASASLLLSNTACTGLDKQNDCIYPPVVCESLDVHRRATRNVCNDLINNFPTKRGQYISPNCVIDIREDYDNVRVYQLIKYALKRGMADGCEMFFDSDNISFQCFPPRFRSCNVVSKGTSVYCDHSNSETLITGH
jgi:hypothetical protein